MAASSVLKSFSVTFEHPCHSLTGTLRALKVSLPVHLHEQVVRVHADAYLRVLPVVVDPVRLRDYLTGMRCLA